MEFGKGFIIIFIIINILLLSFYCPLKVTTTQYYKSGTMFGFPDVSIERTNGSIKKVGTEKLCPTYENYLWYYEHGITLGDIIRETKVDFIKLVVYEILILVIEYIAYSIFISRRI